MEIGVPEGQSKVVCFTVTPTVPQNGAAQEWQLICTSEGGQSHVDRLDIWFSSATPAPIRLQERAILQFTLDPTVQTSDTTWRFVSPGFLFSTEKPDVKDCFSVDVANDGMELTATVRCLDNEGEQFKFSFLAMCTELASGKCEIYASADPNGGTDRRP